MRPSNFATAQLIVRELESAVVRALELRAAKNGMSPEAEHRAILREVLLGRSGRSFKETLLATRNFTEIESLDIEWLNPFQHA